MTKAQKNVNNNKKISSFLTLFFLSIHKAYCTVAGSRHSYPKKQQSAVSSDRSFSSSVPVFRLFSFHTASLNYTFSPFSYTPQCKTNSKYLTSYIVYVRYTTIFFFVQFCTAYFFTASILFKYHRNNQSQIIIGQMRFQKYSTNFKLRRHSTEIYHFH